MLRAVLYLRSSKDRHDIAIDVQRRELTELARVRGYVIDGEFADVVESGKDEDRPGLQAMLAQLRERDRTWTIVIAQDTSRIARRAAAAYWFEDRECRPRGVTVVYKNLPEMDEAERAIVKAVFHGVDEWHSLVSKRKGLAGMRQNVRNGFRAGGRAPTGYRLEHVPTGAVREGSPVVKSRLVPSDDAPKVAAFLHDRAAGIPRIQAVRKHGIAWPQTTLLSIERNALTYAGCTVWNVLKEKGTHGRKFRPAAEWEVKKGTHDALITEEEAIAIREQLARAARARTVPRKHDYLLAGLLCTPAGIPWHGSDAGFYRNGKARRILARRVDRTVVDSVTRDLAGDDLVHALLEHMRSRLLAKPERKRAAAARRRIDTLERDIRKLADLATSADVAAPLMRVMAEKDKEREAAVRELAAIEREEAAQRSLERISEADVRHGLRSLAVDLQAGKSVPGLRDQLQLLLERVELDPADPAEVILRYRIPVPGAVTGAEMASRQRREPNPAISIARRVKLAA